jgi:hypothetical protein
LIRGGVKSQVGTDTYYLVPVLGLHGFSSSPIILGWIVVKLHSFPFFACMIQFLFQQT